MVGRSAHPIVRTTRERGVSLLPSQRWTVARQSLADDAEPFHAELERRPEDLALACVNRRNTS
jgi:hypothetical protein